MGPSVPGTPTVTGTTNSAVSHSLHGGASPAFRGLMTWSINRDRYYDWEFQNSHAPYLDALP